jgi:elongation factor P
MIKASDLKKGQLVEYDKQLYTAHTVTHVSRGNWRSYIQAKLKSVKTGNLIDVRFSVDDKLESPFVETRPYEFLYKEGGDYVLMDPATYDQIHVSAEDMGDAEHFLKGNETITCSMIDGKIVSVELPNVVELAVKDTPPVVKGATATNQTKEAILETGYRVKVPPFIEIGEVLRIDTRTGEYVERAK